MLPRMRTIEAAHAELKAADPGCELTKTAIRRLVISGALPSVRIGQKYLVNMDSLEAFLQGGAAESPAGVIREIRL